MSILGMLAVAIFTLLFGQCKAAGAFTCYKELTPEVTSEMCEEIGPYLIREDHPLKPASDEIFQNQRANLTDAMFTKAGFDVLFRKERSFVRVARHPLLPGHLVKAYIDNDYRLKHDTAGWVWLMRRCMGAKKVRHAIRKHNIRHFQVPKKWLYVLPSVPFKQLLKRQMTQPLILLVQDMDLVSEEENLDAWNTLITKEHLDELYLILTEAGGSSYRPGNIWLSRNGKFSFVDTEYPYRKPDYKRIRPYLSPKMQAYWQKLVSSGRKSSSSS